MDMCNIPELLALDLESAESIFAAKRMTAGAPRSSSFVFDTDSQDDLVLAPRRCDSRFSATSSSAAAATTATSFAAYSSQYELAISDNDTDSIDSFDLPTVSLVSPRRANRRDSLLLAGSTDDGNGDDTLVGDRHSFDDDIDAQSDSSSVSSFNFTVSSARRRHQSVATAATSVISSACRSSGHSHILSALGPSSPGASLSMGEPVAFFERRKMSLEMGAEVEPTNTIPITTAATATPARGADTASCLAPAQSVPAAAEHCPQTSWIDFGGDSDSDSALGEDDDASTQPSSMEIIPETSAELDLPSPPAYYLPPRRQSVRSGQAGLSDDIRRRLSLAERLDAAAAFDAFAGDGDSASKMSPSPADASEDVDVLHGRGPVRMSSPYRKPLRRFSSQTLRAVAHAPPASVSQTTLRRAYSHKEDRRSSSAIHQTLPALTRGRMFLDGYGNDLYTLEQPLAELSLLRSQFEDDNKSSGQASAEAGAEEVSRTTSKHIPPQSLRSRLSVISREAPSIVPTVLDVKMQEEEDGTVKADRTPEKPSPTLQSWLQHTTASTHQGSLLLRENSVASKSRVSAQAPLQTPPTPLMRRPSPPSTVAVPLPKEVVDMLRVSVSCFPETMLSLSSFSIQTIRSYARKVRSLSADSDNDSIHRLLLSPESSRSPATPTTVASPLSSRFPASPLSASASSAAGGYASSSYANSITTAATTITRSPTNASRQSSVAAAASSSPSSLRKSSFWKLSRRLLISRTSPNLRAEATFPGSARSGLLATRAPGSQLASQSNNNNNNRPETSSSFASTQRGGGACFKAIFPTGAEYLCDALYAHIVAFNYVSLLCPGTEFGSASLSASIPPPLPTTTAAASPTTDLNRSQSNRTSVFSMAFTTGSEFSADPKRRQTIRVYAGENGIGSEEEKAAAVMTAPEPDVAEESAMQKDMLWLDDDGDDEEDDVDKDTLSPLSSSRPATLSRAADDDSRCISRKAASLLGISNGWEPAAIVSQRALQNNMNGNSSSDNSSRRYASLLWHPRSAEHSDAAMPSTPSAPIKHKHAVLVKRSATAPALETTMGKSTLDGAVVPALASAATPRQKTSTVFSDAMMRDLHAGLAGCIGQLVATLKTSASAGPEDTVVIRTATAGGGSGMDPLFLRTLCELVRSQEERM